MSATNLARQFDGKDEPAPLLGTAEADALVTASIASGWLTRAEALLSGATDPAYMLRHVALAIRTANDAVEAQQFGVDNADALQRARESQVGYYSAPILAVRKKDERLEGPVAIPALQKIYTEQLRLGKPARLIVPRTREDLERIGTQRDFLSMLFWAEVQSTHARQMPMTNRAIYNSIIGDRPAIEQRRLTMVCDMAGHDIHTLLAKDSTGRRARYFLYVAPDVEKRFLDAFHQKDDGVLELEDHGQVIASHYLSIFRNQQLEAAHRQFQDIIDRYARLAERQRSYSYDTGKQAADFKARRFGNAMLDAGSRSALASELAEQAIAPAEPAAAPAEPATSLFRRGFTGDAQTVVLHIARERQLSFGHLLSMARLLLAPEPEDVAAAVSRIASACRQVGDDPEAFDRFILLISQNRTLTHEYALAAALLMARRQQRASGASRFRTLLGALARTASFRPKAVDAQCLMAGAETIPDLRALRADLAALDVALHLSGDPDALLARLRACVETRRPEDVAVLADELHRTGAPYYRELEEVRGAEEIERLGLRVEHVIISRVITLYLSHGADTLDRKFISAILDSGFIEQFRALALLGRTIEAKPYSEKFETLRELLTHSLQEPFEQADYPADQREQFITKMAEALLKQRHLSAPESTAGTEPENPGLLPLPTEAPIKWKDREPGETAPDFARRVYGQWLKDGMSKRALRKLDAALLNELNTWVRNGNEMPADIKLLSVGEENQRLLDGGPEAIREHLGKFTGQEAIREAQRLGKNLSRLR